MEVYESRVTSKGIPIEGEPSLLIGQQGDWLIIQGSKGDLILRSMEGKGNNGVPYLEVIMGRSLNRETKVQNRGSDFFFFLSLRVTKDTIL